jgi:hypothetical protein
MRQFELWRSVDESGVSGTGKVAHGVEFEDNQCVMFWLTATASLGIYKDAELLIKIHGHNGATVLRWID